MHRIKIARKYPPGAGEERINRILLGDFLHLVLYYYSGDLEEAFERAREKMGFVPEGAWEDMERIERLFDDPFFKEIMELPSMREVEVELKDGLGKIDRLSFKEDKVLVVDYKTGEEEKEHVDQVKRYMEGIGEIFPTREVEGVLVYLEKGILRRVTWE